MTFPARLSATVTALLVAATPLLANGADEAREVRPAESAAPADGAAPAHALERMDQQAAQQGAVTGRVTAAGNQQPVEGAQVFVAGTEIGGLTGADGRYRLEQVPEGQVTVRVQMIGYETAEQTVTVSSGQAAEASFQLQPEAIGMEEIVVTGLASETSRATAEVSVSSIDAAQIDAVSHTDLSSLMSGKAAGVSIKRASGQVGSGMRFKIRGGGGLTGTGQPVIYVDGVRVDNEEVEGPGTGGQGYGMLSSLSPDQIENIEILKGAAGAAMYGTAGSNGVVLITTKSGSGAEDRSATFNVQSTLGMNERHTPYSTENYLTAPGANSTFVQGDLIDAQANISGQTGDISYYASAGRRHEEGILQNISMTRYPLQGNFEVNPSEELSIDVNSNFTPVTQNKQNLDNAFGPLNNTLFISNQELWSKTGSEEAVYAFRDVTETKRFTGSVNLTWTPIQAFDRAERLQFRAQLGYDGSNLREDQVEPAGFSYGGDTDGNKEVYQRTNHQQNLNLNARYTYGLTSDLQATSVAGVQAFNRLRETTSIEMDVFPAEPLMNLDAGQSFLGTNETALHERQAGLFASQQFNYDNTYFGTLALRRDYASNVGDRAPAIWYPKASGSVRLDRLGVQPGPVTFLKVRAAYGQSGKLPEPRDGVNRLWGGSNFGLGTGAVLNTIGNEEIEPERVGEIEVGFDATLAERYQIGFTHYRSYASQSIIGFQQSPSTGLTADNLPVNVGEIDSWGIEASLDAALIQGQQTRLDAGVEYSYSANEVKDMGEAQPIFGGFDNVIEEGIPRAGFYPLQHNGASFNEDGIYAGPDISLDDRHFVGTPYPKHEVSLSLNFTFLEDFTAYALTEASYDFYALNATNWIAEAYGNHARRLRLAARIGDDRFRDIWEEEFPNVEQVEPGTDEYREAANQYALLDQTSTQGYIERSDFLSGSEFSLSYNATDLLRQVGVGGAVSNARLRAAVRNAFLLSKYSGPDPRLDWQGGRTITQSVDFTSLQHPRTWTLSVNLTF